MLHLHHPLPDHPPSPHDPRERCAIFDHGDWQVRTHAWNDPKHAYLAPRGLLHLQLWHAERQISVLTPSRLTDKNWELWTRGERARLCCYGHLATALSDQLQLSPPCPRVIRHFELWFVWARAVGAVAR